MFGDLFLRLLWDDGAVVHLNGIEVFRSNMPTGTISATTFALTPLAAPEESDFVSTSIERANLLSGTNVLAVEVHQANLTSSDLSFDLEVLGVLNRRRWSASSARRTTPRFSRPP